MTRLLFVVDAGFNVGLGHLIRSITLAAHMEREYQIRPTFVLGYGADPASKRRVGSHGWPLYCCGCEGELPKLIEEVVSLNKPHAVAYDLERGAPSTLEWRAAGKAKTVAFIGAGYKAKDSERLTWSFVQGVPVPPPAVAHCHYGTEYVVLRDDFRQDPRIPRDATTVFVCGGGSDPFDLTNLACEALGMLPIVKLAHVVLGSFYRGRIGSNSHGRDVKFSIHRDIENPYELMALSGAAIVSYGMVALEALAAGLPTIVLSVSQDHLASADALAKKYSALISLGLISEMTVERVATATGKLLTDCNLRLRLGQSARSAVDGKGVERVAKLIMKAIS